jgi:hypothetical protein
MKGSVLTVQSSCLFQGQGERMCITFFKAPTGRRNGNHKGKQRCAEHSNFMTATEKMNEIFSTVINVIHSLMFPFELCQEASSNYETKPCALMCLSGQNIEVLPSQLVSPECHRKHGRLRDPFYIYLRAISL